MQINLSMFPEDNHYVIETHQTRGGVETDTDLAYLFLQFANAIGFSFVGSVAFYDNKGNELTSSNDLMNINFGGSF